LLLRKTTKKSFSYLWKRNQRGFAVPVSVIHVFGCDLSLGSNNHSRAAYGLSINNHKHFLISSSDWERLYFDEVWPDWKKNISEEINIPDIGT
jgi:hypothetical protein